VVAPGFIREAGMFADSGAKPPAPLGTATPEQVGSGVLRAIERDKLEVVVAPLPDRLLTHVALTNPAVADRIQSGSRGQKAAQAIAEGHPPEKR
jgi:hypothetical protein